LDVPFSILQSGVKTGADAAIICNVPYGGWLPKGRKTKNWPLLEGYSDFQVLAQGRYPKRTEQNVIDSLIIQRMNGISLNKTVHRWILK